MQVIPVIDVMHGQVVRGVAGRRSEYRPIETILAADTRPSTVARALAACGFRVAYVAEQGSFAKVRPDMKIVFIRDVEDLEERLKATTAILRNLVRIAGKTKKAA